MNDLFSVGAAYAENNQLDKFHDKIFPIIQQILFTMKDKKVCEQLVEIFLNQVKDLTEFKHKLWNSRNYYFLEFDLRIINEDLFQRT